MTNKEFLEYLKVAKGVKTDKINFRLSIERSQIDMSRLFTRLYRIRDDIDKNLSILSLVSFYELDDSGIETLLFCLGYANKIFSFLDSDYEEIIKEIFHRFYELGSMEKAVSELMADFNRSSRYTRIDGEVYLIVGNNFYKCK